MYKLCFFIPESHLEPVKNALFAVGVGAYQHYDQCAWQTLGQGQFRPLAGNHAFIGSSLQLERIAEYKVEMVCADDLIEIALNTLIANHPYETPAYEVYPIYNAAQLAQLKKASD